MGMSFFSVGGGHTDVQVRIQEKRGDLKKSLLSRHGSERDPYWQGGVAMTAPATWFADYGVKTQGQTGIGG